MPSNPLTQEEVNSYAINRVLNPEGYTGLTPYMPGGYFLSAPAIVNGPVLWRLFDASFISTGIIDRNRLGTGSTGLGNLYLADDGTWKLISTGGGGDMLKATYDVDNDGVVDSAEAIQIIVRNSTGSTLTKGQVVYLNGATGNRPNAVLSKADTEATSSKTIGIVVANISNNSDGYIAVNGTLHNLDTSAFTAGDAVWLSATTAGGMTSTIPAEPNHTVFIGYIARSHPTQGRIVLHFQNGYELNELHGVLIASEANNDLLTYESSTGLWKNKALSSVLSVDANEGLTLSGGSLGTIYNTLIADGVNSVAVGGATVQPASSWRSKTLVQVLDTILFPTILASITTVKSASLAVSGTSGTVEIGTSVSRTLTATFVQGTITNGDGTVNANPLVGAASNYAFSGTGISLTNQAGNTLAITVAVISGTNNWAVTVTHAIGTGAYFDNKGVAGTNLDASRVAGTIVVSSSTPTVTGRYRQFFGPTTTTPTTSAEVRAFGSNFTDTNSFNSGTFTQTKFVIAIPATRNLVSVITSSLENITSNFVLATFNVNDAGGTAVSYKVYTFTSVTPLGLTATITLS